MTSSIIVIQSPEPRTRCCHSNAALLENQRKRISLRGIFSEGERIPCSVRNERSDAVRTFGKNDCRMKLAKAGLSADTIGSGSPLTGSAINRCASEKFETPATESTASFQSGKDRAVENASGAGCLNSQITGTDYGSCASNMLAA